MVPMMTLSFATAALLALSLGLASPIPAEVESRVDSPLDDDDASASAPTNFLTCANGVGEGNGFNNCSMPAAPAGFPSAPDFSQYRPGGSGGGIPSMPSGPPSMPNQGSINQGIECATAVGQGNGINNCSNILGVQNNNRNKESRTPMELAE